MKTSGSNSMEFKVGDRVLLSPTSYWRGGAHQLPKGVVGTVILIKEYGYPVKVEWFVGGVRGTNVYDHDDLVFAKDHYIKRFKEDYAK